MEIHTVYVSNFRMFNHYIKESIMTKPIFQRGKFYKSYKKLITKSIPINNRLLKNGYIIKSTYDGINRSGKKESIYIVIHPNYNKKVHVLDLDYVKPQVLDKIIKLNSIISTNVGDDEINVIKFSSKEKTLYNSLMKLDSTMIKSYRQLEFNKMSNTEVVDLNIELATDPTTIKNLEQVPEDDNFEKETLPDGHDEEFINNLVGEIKKSIGDLITGKHINSKDLFNEND